MSLSSQLQNDGKNVNEQQQFNNQNTFTIQPKTFLKTNDNSNKNLISNIQSFNDGLIFPNKKSTSYHTNHNDKPHFQCN